MNNLLDDVCNSPSFPVSTTASMDSENCNHTNYNVNDSNEELRQRLIKLRQKRKFVQQQKHKCQQYQEATKERLDGLKLQRQTVAESYQSVLQQRRAVSHYLYVAERWNVTNDCFHIWHQGPFGTILNVRLGLEAPNLQQPQDHHHSDASSAANNNHNNAAPPAAPRRYLLWSSMSITAAPTESTTNNNNNNNHNNNGGYSFYSSNTSNNNALSQKALVVPWPEINAALGHVVLLLTLLQERVGFTFTHTLIPMASTSKILLKPKNTSAAYYNLFFDDSGVFMGRGYMMRNFHTALQGLLQCLAEASAQLVDKTIALPHAITHTTTPTDEWKIGGLSINPDEQPESKKQQWTRACKYLLTDLKWLVAYAVKHHVDR